MSEYRENVIERYKLNSDILDRIFNNSDIEDNEKIVEIMNYIGEKRGAIARGNNVDLDKTSRIILEDFRSGNLGRITLETVTLKD